MYQHTQPDPLATESFPTDPSGLPEASRPQLLELAPDDTLDLRVGPVAKHLGDTTVRMLGYNGSIPGPTLKVQQGSEIIVHVTNQGDLDTTVHWHGLRLENKYDGVPHETQAPIPVGGEFTYRIQFPDPGLYWYHPHIREDYTQELGLYANILVEPSEPEYWPPADRDFILTVDDLLVEDGKVAPFSPTETSYAAMGRFGNVFLTSGDPDLHLAARAGEVVRLWLTNTANTRVFNLMVPGARLKLVGRGQRPGRAPGVRRVGGAGPLGAGGGRRPVRPARRAGPGAPHPRPDLPAGHPDRGRGRSRAVGGGGGVRGAAPRS
jgi:FtsP/CotA-like multicopper oxidase with cupredoxin domain